MCVWGVCVCVCVGGECGKGSVVVVVEDMKSGDISSAISGIGFVVFSTLVICWLC